MRSANLANQNGFLLGAGSMRSSDSDRAVLFRYRRMGNQILIHLPNRESKCSCRDEFFTGFISESVSPVVWFAIFILLTSAIVIFGVEKGVEKASRFMMPLLIVLIVGVCIFCITRPGAAEGVSTTCFLIFLNFLPQRCWLLWDNYLFPCLLPWVS